MNSGLCVILDGLSPVGSMKITYPPTADPSGTGYGTRHGHLLLLSVLYTLSSKILRQADQKVSVCHIRIFHN